MTEANITGTQIPGGELEKPETRALAIEGTQATLDEPSAAWGWSGAFPKATRVAGWSVAVILLLLLIGNHRGRVEDIWVLVFFVGLVGILVRDIVRRRHAWRR